MSIILDGSEGITQADKFNSNATFGFRNRIINGDMRIDQRNAGAAVTASGSFPVDRFVSANVSDGAFSAQQDSSAPSGFVNSMKFTTTTADASLSATQFLVTVHKIEGANVADLGWGTASAKTVTISFWTRSSLTGTFGCSIRNGANNRSYPFTYTISAADTWEYKTITIPGDTTGTWLTTTGSGLELTFGLGVGSTFSGTAGAWAGANYLSATGAVSVIGTLNATWYVTGVQLEAGSVATPFERRPFGTELQLCQRYLPAFLFDNNTTAYGFTGQCISGTQAVVPLIFQVQPRVAPTGIAISSASHFQIIQSNGVGNVCSTLTFNQSSKQAVLVLAVIPSSVLTAGHATILGGTNTSGLIYANGCEL
jgi:hypothetical protein